MENFEREENTRRNDVQYIFSTITREINNIIDGEKPVKKQSAENLYNFIAQQKPSFKNEIVQEILISFNKNLIKIALFDPLEKCREYSIKILIYLYSNCTNIAKFFPFIFSALVDKLECQDLEGYNTLPEEMRPNPCQKPQKVIKITEPCEAIRILYIKLLETIVYAEYDKDQIRIFIQDLVNLTRTLAMDPNPDVILSALDFMQKISLHLRELLFYFNSTLARSLYLSLTHRQSKLRVAGLEALEKLMYISPFKKNIEIMEQMIGFRDPNLVPIKDFYEPSAKINYFALLSGDASQQVLRKFYDTITIWLLKVEDRFDHECRLLPYIITGLFLENHEEINLFVNERMEEIGILYEKDNEKEIREDVQYGIDAKWIDLCGARSSNNINDNGKVSWLFYPFPLSGRPRLGSRYIMRKYLRRYIKSLCREFDCIEESIRKKCANLLFFAIVYCEDLITEYLDQTMLCFERELIKYSNFINAAGGSRIKMLTCKEIVEPIFKSLRMIGRFCDYEAITKIVYPTIEGDLNGNYQDIQRGALICLKYIFQGHIQSLAPAKGFGIFSGKLKEIIGTINSARFIDYLDHVTSVELINFYESFLSDININKEKIGDISECLECLETIYKHLLQSFSCLAIFDLQSATSSSLLTQIEKKLESINNSIISLMKYNKETNPTITNTNSTGETEIGFNSYFSFKTSDTLDQIISQLEEDKCFITQNSKNYKLFYMILKSKLFIFDLHKNNDLNKSVVKKILFIFTLILKNSHNFTIHQDVVKLLIHYLTLSDFECFKVILDSKKNPDALDAFVDVIYTVFLPYTEIEIEKFKFADLLKDEKELEKKKMKSPKTVKSEIREKILLFVQTMFNKFPHFNLMLEENKKEESKQNISFILDKLLKLFNKTTLDEFKFEHEKNRKIFIELLNKFLIKFFTFNKINLDKNDEKYEEIKTFVNNFEEYFAEETYDSITEVRQCCLTILNLILSAFNKSDYYDPFVKSFSKPENFEVVSCLRYLEDEHKKINSYFKDFKKIFSVVMNLYIDERLTFSTYCETSFKLILEKFPIFTFDELLKARNKSQISRVEALDKIFKKYCKV